MPVLRYSSTVSSLTKRVVALVTVPLAMLPSCRPVTTPMISLQVSCTPPVSTMPRKGVLSAISFLHWLALAWPWGLVLLVLSYVFIQIFYAPKEDTTVSVEFVKEQRAALGKMGRNEKITAVVLVLCLALWVTEADEVLHRQCSGNGSADRR